MKGEKEMLSYYILSAVIIIILVTLSKLQKGKGAILLVATLLALIEILIGMFLYIFLFKFFISVYNYQDNESIILILTLTIVLGFIMYLVNRCLFIYIFKLFKIINERTSVIIICEYIVQCILIFLTVIQASYQHLNYSNKYLKQLACDVGSLAVLPTLISIIIGIVLYKLENKNI